VSHELKNPLTSLRSALESLDKVDDPQLRAQLLGIARHDVDRVGWLITEIADASRIDAELSRTDFVTLDMLTLIRALVGERETRGVNGGTTIRINRHGNSSLLVAGDAPRLERVLHNLLDNAVSFSPPGLPIDIDLSGTDEQVDIAISDHGPGIPASARELVFERFHSLRPAGEAFGSHSGLGLAIARTIVEAHFGSLTAMPRADGEAGACLIITLPALQTE
jgi:two-component system sensor histidine kinase ChvG